MKQELNISVTTPSKFFAKLFEARDTIHLCHLGTKSFAEHIALDALYKSILKLIDKLIESYQGKYGIVDITIPSSSKMDCIVYLNSFVRTIETTRQIFKESCIQNLIDEIMQDTYQTIYKLTNLK